MFFLQFPSLRAIQYNKGMEKDYDKNFEEAYKKLNTAQKQAVDEIEGPVMVIAGPGTGKTQILTMRIANICKKTDTEPENILALTFTEAATSSMKRRLVELMGPGGYQVMINTFHGFANDIIKNFPEEFPKLIGGELLDDVTRIKLHREIIEELPLLKLRPTYAHDYYLYDINRAIGELKREGITVSEFEKIIQDEKEGFELIPDLYHESGAHKGKKKGKYIDLEKQIAKREELAMIYKRYEERLISERLYDYNDMLMEALRVLRDNPELLLSIQERYHYVLVDEHQDTNRTQNKIIELIANFHDNPNVFIVGDEKQAIYRFQGASLENFLYFTKLYPKAKYIVLEENYRSTQTILDSAHSIIEGKKPLLARAGHKDEKIQVRVFSNQNAELKFVAQDINKKIIAEIKPEEIAVLYRENKDSREIAEMLSRYGIPFAIDPGESILYDHTIGKILEILKAINTFGDQKELITAMHIDCFKIDIFDILKILKESDKSKISIFDILENNETLTSLKLNNEKRVRFFYSFMKRRAAEMGNISPLRSYENVIKKSGIMRQVVGSEEGVQSLEKINGLFKELKKFIQTNKNAGIGDFLEYLGVMKENNIPLAKMNLSPEMKKVKLMTAHKSKGLEFEYVYLINTLSNTWEQKRSADKLPLPVKIYSIEDNGELSGGERIEDERKLFYVALTRAKKGMSVSYSKTDEEGKEKFPTVFIAEMKQDLLEYSDMAEYERNISRKDELAFGEIEKNTTSEGFGDLELIKETVMRRGFSPTDINSFLSCPWKYFYGSLFRVPQAMTKPNAYGSAIHGALEDYFRNLERGEEKPAEFVYDRFKIHLSKQPLNDADIKELETKGKKAITGFINKYSGTWEKNFLTEFSVSGTEIDGIPIKGRMDRVEFLSNGKARVIDFKTGKVKTMGQIAGETKDSNGDIKRQIIFYKLLLQQYKDKKYIFDYGRIDFVEPDNKGEYHREDLCPDDNDVKRLIEEIKFVYDEVINLKFWNRRCSNKDCEYCKMRDLGKKEPEKITRKEKEPAVDNFEEE